jgi:hypothetical protein
MKNEKPVWHENIPEKGVLCKEKHKKTRPKDTLSKGKINAEITKTRKSKGLAGFLLSEI